jgi:RNA polymerase sigma-70 factor, ECF subfamily
MSEDRPGRPDDVALVRAVAGGSYEALANLYDRHANAVYAVACRLTSDRGVAEEVVQDTFLALWDRAESFDPAAGSLAAWLHTIARNRTVDRLRAIGRRPQLAPLPSSSTPDTSETELLDRAAAGGTVVAAAVVPAGPEAAYESIETRAAIVAALDGMAAEERTVIVLAYREDLTQTEIAERLGWPLGTVKTRTRRALRRLREALDDGTIRPVGTGGDE